MRYRPDQPICYRKTLVDRLGLNNDSLTPLIARTETFQNVESQQGYATLYTFRDVLLLFIGSKLMSLNMPLRAADSILFKIKEAHVDGWIKDAEGMILNRTLLLIHAEDIDVLGLWKCVIFRVVKKEKLRPMTGILYWEGMYRDTFISRGFNLLSGIRLPLGYMMKKITELERLDGG